MGPQEPSSSSPSPPRRPAPGWARQLALATELPFLLVAAVLVGGGLGYLLDSRMHTTPLWTLLLGFAGFLGGIREVLRRLKANKSDGQG